MISSIGMSDSPRTSPCMNQSRLPQCGHRASPGGMDGSMRTAFPQTGQLLGAPSGVREDIESITRGFGRITLHERANSMIAQAQLPTTPYSYFVLCPSLFVLALPAGG